MGRQLTIVLALLFACAVLVAAMAWSTAARGQEPEKTEDVLRVERAVTELAPAKRAREFPPNMEADYKSGDIYNRMVRFVEDTRRKAARRHWGSRYDAALRSARDRLIELGGNDGYATFFSFGHSLRG